MLKPMRPCTEGPWQGRPGTAPLRLAMALTLNLKTMAGKHDERAVAACMTPIAVITAEVRWLSCPKTGCKLNSQAYGPVLCLPLMSSH